MRNPFTYRPLPPAALLAGLLFIHPLPASGSGLRDLPSLEEAWRWAPAGRVEGMAIAADAVFVLAEGELVALDADSGAVRWEHPLPPADCCSLHGPVLLAERVAVATGDELVLLDRTSGVEVVTPRLAGRIADLAGPPLVARILAEDAGDVVARIDSVTGAVLARRTLPGTAYDLEPFPAALVAKVGDDQEYPLLLGLDPGDLAVLWQQRMDRYLSLIRDDDSLWISTYSDDDRELFLHLDPRTGALGSPRPPRPPARAGGGSESWELQLVDLDDGGAWSEIRRNDPSTGATLWQERIPGTFGPWVREGDALYLDAAPPAGRGLLLALDWATGDERWRAYGLRRPQQLVVHGDLLLARLQDGVVAVARGRLGPPASATGDPTEEARAILRRLEADSTAYFADARDAAAELATLGDAAMAPIAALLPGLGPTATGAATLVLEQAGYRPAAPALAAALARIPRDPEGDHRWIREQLVEAVGALGSDTELAPLAGLLADPAEDADLRRAACTALGRIGTPAALALADRALQDAAPERITWWPPVPSEGIRKRAAALARGAAPEAGEAWVPRRDGGWLVFSWGLLGGAGDLWLMPVDATGAPSGPPLFLDLPLVIPSRFRSPGFVARAEGADGLAVRPRDPTLPEQRRKLSDLRRDGDGDGLPDAVEQRLHLDPGDPDSDGDGLADATDPAPQATVPRPRDEDESAALALFLQFFAFRDSDAAQGLAVVEGDTALEWRGRSGPTLTLTSDQAGELRETTGLDGIGYVTLRPGDSAQREDEDDALRSPPPDLAPGERFLRLEIYRGMLNAAGYGAVMRQEGERWWLTRLFMEWIS